MSYKSSPRPSFSQPTHIRYENVTRHLWGDAASGRVDDWIYTSSQKIHQLVFGLPPSGAFRHSEEFRTVFGADEVLFVLQGTYISANPETGEVHVAKPGEAIFFRKDTWHHGFNASTEPLRVLEYFAPPPATGTSGAYARTRPYVDKPIYGRDSWLGRIPMENDELAKSNTMRVLRDADVQWRLEGESQGALVGIYAATEYLTAGKVILMPGQTGALERHGGDECLYVAKGTLNVLAPETEGQTWFELNPRDGFFVPEGASHQYQNLSAESVEFYFGVAPRYLPG